MIKVFRDFHIILGVIAILVGLVFLNPDRIDESNW
jgi:hypothetical protein